ncbi:MULTISPECIES: pyridoxamine 5'-phosphate oxidase family protein [Spirulina sp. CCY15215]|uniref:HugZ family pyridoxamine 5'-phosphate oxidase n=1 Tax=Spirulina sp. CCY15215 TaxID=2767591 RepID=UPI0019513519|nr:pyridoxamine 5'-phosphate oxidase family protein [Spirulina major]
MTQIEQVQIAYQEFCDRVRSVILSTVSKEGVPNASYAPFVMDEQQNIYFFASGLALHTQNLKDNSQVSILFIEDESKCEDIFARPRLSLNCQATFMERETETWQQIGDRFEERFGETIQILRSLPDFRIVKLTPRDGRFVLGFGRVYRVSREDGDTLTLITG